MNSPLAPRRRSGRLGFCLGLTLVGLILATVPTTWAQRPSGKSATGKAASKSNQADSQPDLVNPELEIWADPHRLDLIEVEQYPEISGPFLTPAEERQFQAMVQGQSSADRDLIEKYVNRYAAELTKHANLNALLNPEPSPRGARSNPARVMEDATSALLSPLLDPVTVRTAPFHRLYNEALLGVAPDLLNGHLHTRTFFMVVLSRSQSPEFVPTLNGLLTDPEQPLMVKLLAALGLTNITQGGRQSIDANTQAIPAAEALTQFLEENPEAFWPAKWRALQALGSVRHATANPLQGEPEFTVQPFLILANPKERLEVRSWAAWALGMINIPGQVREYNYGLIAYEIGQAALVVGEQILEVPISPVKPTQNLRIVARLSDPLLRFLSAFVGDPDIRNSGLSNARGPSAMSARTLTQGVEQRIHALATSALAYSQSAGSNVPSARDRVAEDVAELRSYLSKNAPKDLALYPNGPTIELPGAQKAGPQAKKDNNGAAGGG